MRHAGLLFLLLIMSVVCLPLGGIGLADLTVYTDFASFDLATDTAIVENFESVGAGFVAPFTSHGIDYSGILGCSLYVATLGHGGFGTTPTSSVLTGVPDEFFQILLNDKAAKAVGFDVYLYYVGSPVTTEYYGSTGNLLGSVSDNRGTASVWFLGVLADEAIHKVVWKTGNYGDQLNTGIDNLRLGTVTSVVPVPGAMLLGFLGLGYAGMRLRKVA